MRGAYREGLIALLAGALAATACGDGAWVPVPGTDGAVKSASAVRSARRAYDGAPPVVPHDDMGMACAACHDRQGMPVPDLGFAPASPHEGTALAFSTVRCRQCHVFAVDTGVFVGSSFVGLRQDLQPGGRLYAGAPPTIPHRVLMRENCLACHDGPGARAEIVTSHPDRDRCVQCHVAVESTETFTSAFSDQARPEGP